MGQSAVVVRRRLRGMLRVTGREASAPPLSSEQARCNVCGRYAERRAVWLAQQCPSAESAATMTVASARVERVFRCVGQIRGEKAS